MFEDRIAEATGKNGTKISEEYNSTISCEPDLCHDQVFWARSTLRA